MSLNNILPFISTVIMLAFTISVFRRYLIRRTLAYLFWGVGLAMFCAVSFSEAFLSLAWSPLIFYLWYLCGPLLVAAWLGHGTLNLLVRKQWVNVLTVILIIGSIAAAILTVTTPLDAGDFETSIAISEQYREIMPEGATVRMTTPFFNIYGTITLVGGALYSSYIFWRKRVLPNRVIGNLLIAVGGLSIAMASLLARLGVGEYLYIGELIAAAMMYGGFIISGRPAKTQTTDEEPSTADPAG